MADLTIAIPIGPGHEQTAERARESVKAQTVEVVGLAWYDQTGKGAGWARNQLLAKVETPYVAYLDADDWLDPTFAERMLAAQAGAGARYTYSGWYETTPVGETEVKPPPSCYCFEANNWWQTHLVTALLPVEWLRAIGGFDEALPGMEDTDLFHRLHEAGHCGLAVDAPLVHYTADGRRSRTFQARADYLEIKEQIGRRYHKPTMSCCDGDAATNPGPFNQRQPGDVLTMVLGASFAKYVGRQSGRIYVNMGHGQLAWAHPADVLSDPVRFRLVEQPPLESAEQIGAVMQQQVRRNITSAASTPAPRSGSLSATQLAKMAGFDTEK